MASFGELLRQKRTEKGLSQQALADLLFVDRSTIVRWETGSRMPDAAQVPRIAASLGVEVGELLEDEADDGGPLNIMMVDDERLILQGGLPVLKRMLPDANVVGFTRLNGALDYAKENRVSIAFLDIEMGTHSGLNFCRSLLDINPRMNIIFLTAYMEYAFDAWETGASGFMLKPINEENVRKQLELLRYPVRGLMIK